MAFYSDVRRGENFKPSALMFNDIARSLNKIDGFRSYGISKVDDGATRISVCNETTETLVARCAVQLYPVRSGINIERPDLSPPYSVSVYDGTSEWDWCILEETLNPGEIGSAILFGVTEVVLSIPTFAPGEIPDKGFAIPNFDNPEVFDIVSYPTQAKLLRVHKNESDRFIAEIAFIPFETGGNEYSGYFKIIMKERSENGEIVFEVVDGQYPENEFCGYTDIRGAEEVRKFQITLEANEETEIYFHACGTPGNYTTVISSLKDNIEGSFDSVLIGRIERSGYIRQILQTDEPLPYKKDWYL